MNLHRRVCATIDMAAIAENLKLLAGKLESDTKLLAVIKADGYGHGAIPIAQMSESYGFIWGFGVATIEEAITLREAGVKKPIMILGFTFPENYEDLVINDLIPTIFSYEQADKLSIVATQANKRVSIHLAVDTGMNRIGFADEEASVQEIINISTLPNILVEGIFSHFARADELNHEPTHKQLRRFNEFVEKLVTMGIDIPLRHASNSAGLLQFPEAHMNIVRAGISIYGLYPSDEMMGLDFKLKPAMTITSHITLVKTVESGEAISYGGTYVTDKKTKVATVPVGYADGYARSLSNKGYVLIRGQKAPILGRICMDQFMVDVSAIDAVAELDEVVLLGQSEDEVITMEMLSETSGRFNYEFACGIAKRVPRVYIGQDGC